MIRLPVIQGLIRRRLLVNFRVDPGVMEKFLPAPFRPKLHAGYAIAGICLIRLEDIRPRGLPGIIGVSSENAAHRIAVLWEDESGFTREGVYIPRRDTDCCFNHLVGGRLFPGEHHLAAFDIVEDGPKIGISVRANDSTMALTVRAQSSENLPPSSCFRSLAESSAFFEGGKVGYSATSDCCRLDGVRLETEAWAVEPLAVDHVESTFFANRSVFPEGSVEFDHALIMRDIRHEWHGEPDMTSKTTG